MHLQLFAFHSDKASRRRKVVIIFAQRNVLWFKERMLRRGRVASTSDEKKDVHPTSGRKRTFHIGSCPFDTKPERYVLRTDEWVLLNTEKHSEYFISKIPVNVDITEKLINQVPKSANCVLSMS